MLYGAYGYTGALIVEEALKRGHRPVLAGRNAGKLQELAQRHDLEHLVIPLDDEAALLRSVAQFDLLFHAAGPFVQTARPMVAACLAGRTHYLDITGEIPILEHTFSLDQEAKEHGVALIGGVGFDVVPSDCLLSYLTDKIPHAMEMQIAFATPGKFSPGTAKTAIVGLPRGGVVRRDSHYRSYALGQGMKSVLFSDGRRRSVMPIPWGDLATGYRTAGVPNITTYMAISARQKAYMRRFASVGQRLMSAQALRHMALRIVDMTVHGPDEQLRQRGRSYLWASASDSEGKKAEAWLETLEPYNLTAVAGVRCVEEVLKNNLSGALTPSQAFGADFVLNLGDTTRHDEATVSQEQRHQSDGWQR
jgi:short subunit dehydrogenase-like uncharacterized protein